MTGGCTPGPARTHPAVNGLTPHLPYCARLPGGLLLWQIEGGPRCQATHNATATGTPALSSPYVSSTPTPESAWIERITYVRGADGTRFLLVWTLNNDGDPGDVLLYGGPPRPDLGFYEEIPTWMPGLLKAGRVGEGSAEQTSVGAVYNRLVKGRYPYQRVSRREITKVLRGAQR